MAKTVTQRKKERRLKRRANQAKARATGNLKSSVIEVTIDNPLFSRDHLEGNGNRRKITAMLNMNESIAAHWYYRKKISFSDFQAATHFRAIWERAGGTGASALDYSIEKVDGGAQADPVSVSRAQAVSELAKIQLRLGKNGYNLLVVLCGECRPVSDVWPTRHMQQKNSEVCRSILRTLSVDMGYRKYVHNRASA